MSCDSVMSTIRCSFISVQDHRRYIFRFGSSMLTYVLLLSALDSLSPVHTQFTGTRPFQAPISCTGGVQFFSSPPASPVIYYHENMLHELVDTTRFLERKHLRAKQVVSRRIPRLRLTRQNPSHAVFSNKECRTRIRNSAAAGLGIRLWLL